MTNTKKKDAVIVSRKSCNPLEHNYFKVFEMMKEVEGQQMVTFAFTCSKCGEGINQTMNLTLSFASVKLGA